MAIQIGGTTVIDNSRNIQNIGFASLSSLSLGGSQRVSSLGVGIRTSGGVAGVGATMIDFRGSGISSITVSSASGIATISIPDKSFTSLLVFGR